ncbi:hypothetical protein Ddc_16779 [Ditylenchus destructor]|nr:hypothetical protein Ddc_16779 [Ditylenchus destructor]
MPMLSVYDLREVLTFHNRRELCHLREVNRQFNAMIHREFDEAPLLIFHKLSYFNNTWKWMTKTPEKMDISEFGRKILPGNIQKLLPISKFLRFSKTEIVFDSTLDPGNTQLLSHLWTGSTLTVSWKGNPPRAIHLNRDLIQKIGHLLAKCKHLNIYGRGSLLISPVLLQGTCETISIRDTTPGHVKFPLKDMVEFLFRPCSEEKSMRRIELTVFCAGDGKQWDEFFQKIEKRFSTAITPVQFHVQYHNFGDDTSPFPKLENHFNKRINCDLSLNGGVGKFVFCAKKL